MPRSSKASCHARAIILNPNSPATATTPKAWQTSSTPSRRKSANCSGAGSIRPAPAELTDYACGRITTLTVVSAILRRSLNISLTRTDCDLRLNECEFCRPPTSHVIRAQKTSLLQFHASIIAAATITDMYEPSLTGERRQEPLSPKTRGRFEDN